MNARGTGAPDAAPYGTCAPQVSRARGSAEPPARPRPNRTAAAILPDRNEPRRDAAHDDAQRHGAFGRPLVRRSRPAKGSRSEPRQRHPVLLLVLPPLVAVGHLRRLALEEEHLRDTFVRVNLGGQRGCVGDLESHETLPFRLEGRNVRYYATVQSEDP